MQTFEISFTAKEYGSIDIEAETREEAVEKYKEEIEKGNACSFHTEYNITRIK